MECMIVHRADEIHKLCFKHEEEGKYYLEPHPSASIFHPIIGWEADVVMMWLEQRGFEYYWEKDND